MDIGLRGISKVTGMWRSLKGALQSLKDPGEWMVRWFGGGSTKAGVSVTPESSLQMAAVFACVRVISESVAGLPLMLYRRLPDGGRQPAIDHPLFRLLHDDPNDELTSFEWREMMQSHLCLRGNSFAFKDISNGGRIKRLTPMHPDRVRVIRDDRTRQLVYEYRRVDNGKTEIFAQDEILHLRGLASDGIMGYSPIELAREAIAVSLAAEEFGARMFSQGTNVGKVLKHPAQLSEKAHARLKNWIEDSHSKLGQSHKPMILEEGMEINDLGISNEDAQFLETRKFQVAEIARIFRVPLHKIGELDRATFSNIENQSIEFVTDTLRPWLVRWEQRLNKSLLMPQERPVYYFEHKIDGLLRGDIKSRNQALKIQRELGIINANEWRELDNRNPIEGEAGEEYWKPANFETKDDGEPDDNTGGDSNNSNNQQQFQA